MEVILVIALVGLIVPAWWLADRAVTRERAALGQVPVLERPPGGAPDASIRRAD